MFNGDQYASRVGFREERVARNAVAAREINETIEETDPPTAPSSTCCANAAWRTENVSWPSPGLSSSGFESDPRQFVILPSHLIPEVEDAVQESDGFLIVAKRGGTPEDIAVRTDRGARDTTDDGQSWTIAQRSRRS